MRIDANGLLVLRKRYPIYDVRYKRFLLGDVEVDVEDPLWQEAASTARGGGLLNGFSEKPTKWRLSTT